MRPRTSIDVSDLYAWTTYAETLGAMAVPPACDDQLHVRIDERPHRVIVQRSDIPNFIASPPGWGADPSGVG